MLFVVPLYLKPMHSLASHSCHRISPSSYRTVRHDHVCNQFAHFLLVAARARSAKASLRLNLASSMTPNLAHISHKVLLFIVLEKSSIPASASEEKCADHCTKVDPSLGPVVTG